MKSVLVEVGEARGRTDPLQDALTRVPKGGQLPAEGRPKVLVLAYDYPPRGWSGVQRTVKFVKYLPLFGWDPVVVAPANWFADVPLDTSFCREVEHAATVRTPALTRESFDRLAGNLWRILGPFLKRIGKNEAWLRDGLGWRLEALLFPDEGMAWLPYAVRAGVAVARTQKPAALYATAPPFSTLLAGRIIAARTGLPWVADLRDLWVDNPTRRLPGRIKRALDRWLERKVLSGADRIVTTTRAGAGLLRDKFPEKGDHISVIYNGFDEEDFPPADPRRESSGPNGRLLLSHVGSLYAERTPEPFLRALARFLDRHPDARARLRVRFVGEVSAFEQVFRRYEGLGVVTVEPPVEHPEAVKLMRSSDALVLLMPRGDERVVYAKLFEYMAAGRPILGVMPPDAEVAELLRESGNAWLADVGNEEAVVRCLSAMYKEWSEGGRVTGGPQRSFVEVFERKRLSARLAEVLEAVVRPAVAAAATNPGGRLP